MQNKITKIVFSGLVMVFICTSLLAQTSESAKPVAPRQKFKSKMHIPIKLASDITPLPPAGYKLVWSDEFDGNQIDMSKWVFRTDSKLFSTQKPENVKVSDGKLHLLLKKEQANGKEYTGGGVISKETFVYAYYEARFRTPPAEGWHTSFWTQFHDGSGGTIPAIARLELDICEQDGGDPCYYSFGVINHKPDKSKKEKGNVGRWVIEDTPDTSADFHIWGCEFTPDKVRFYFDGKLAREIDANTFPHEDMNVWLTSIAGKMKGDRFIDDSKLPNEAVYDYVRVYQNPKYLNAEKAVKAAAAQWRVSRKNSK